MKDAYYFPHDSNAKDDPKCILLIEQLGLEGYGIYWVLIETLRDQPNYSYPLALLPALARRFNTTAEKMKTVVMNYNLFHISEDQLFFSDSLIKRMQLHEDRKLKRSLAGKKGNEIKWKEHHIAIANGSQCDRNASQGKEKKGKEKKGEDNKIKEKKIPPTLDEVKSYFKEKGYEEKIAIKFFESYSVANWTDSKGAEILNWKQKAINVWFKDENKIKEPAVIKSNWNLL